MYRPEKRYKIDDIRNTDGTTRCSQCSVLCQAQGLIIGVNAIPINKKFYRYWRQVWDEEEQAKRYYL